MRVALVHDWLTGLRGGERVLDQLCALFPDADLFTLLHVPGTTTQRIEARRIVVSPLARLPGIERHYRKALPLFPWAIGRLRAEGYDLVLSTHHAVAKAIPHPADTPHLCVCFTPMRYVWDQLDAYLGRGARRALAAPLVAYLRRFDVQTSTPDRVTRVVAISHTVAERVRRAWRREARVIHPPVDLERVRPDGRPPDDFYLLVGGFVPYKREDVAIEAVRALGRRLVVVGDGPGRARLARGAPRHVEFTGRIADAELARLYARCRALLHPQEEDFGLVALEAQAAGRPVVALGRGGASETVVACEDLSSAARSTGVLFAQQTPEALAAALRRFEAVEAGFDPARIRAHAERFSPERFRAEIAEEVEATLGAAGREAAPHAVDGAMSRPRDSLAVPEPGR
jgi:glycosyltransferase involved in cell wall biosynthesis